eukprot:1242581-Prymnesium_polylepis.2
MKNDPVSRVTSVHVSAHNTQRVHHQEHVSCRPRCVVKCVHTLRMGYAMMVVPDRNTMLAPMTSV